MRNCQSLRQLFYCFCAVGYGLTAAAVYAQKDPNIDGTGPRVRGPGARVLPAVPRDETLIDDSLSSLFERDRVPCSFEVLPSWQGRDHCGLNCVFALLTLAGRPVTYPTLSARAGTIPKGGLSLEQMLQLTEDFGLRCVLITGDVRELGKLKPPAIIHLGDVDRPGHFVCYYANQGDRLQFIDGTSGGTFEAGNSVGRSLDSLARWSSGYMLVPSSEQDQPRTPFLGWPFKLLALSLSAASAALWTMIAIRYYRRKRVLSS